MQGFEFFGVGRVVFGRGRFATAGELASQLGRAALVVYNGDEPGRGGALDRLGDQLKSSGIRATLVRQRGEPTVDDVDRALATARGAECDCVIGLGGGSAIDAAKATAGLLANGGTALDYMEVVGKGQKITKPALPWMAIPTTAGTGAEATRNAVIGFPEKKFKASIRSEMLLPRVALIDPELAINVPAAVTAASGMDALCQLIESYTSTGANPLTDVMAMHGIALAARSLLRAHRDGTDIDAREDMAMAALLSGVTLTSAGLGAVHGFAAPIGANFPVPHGAVCAALLPHVIRANVEALMRNVAGAAALDRYAQIGRLLANDPSLVPELATFVACHRTGAMATALKIPPLSTFGLTRECIPEMVALARKASSMRFNPVTLSNGELAEILERALDGVV
jgi:alcohol dehydrogenase class IV